MPMLFSPRQRALRWHLTAVSVGLLLPTLTAVRVLLWRFGGNVTVNSDYGIGSTFTLILPARPGSQQDQQRALNEGG